jgi:hypothetical protein
LNAQHRTAHVNTTINLQMQAFSAYLDTGPNLEGICLPVTSDTEMKHTRLSYPTCYFINFDTHFL